MCICMSQKDTQTRAKDEDKVMDNTSYVALSRQQALWNNLEVVANNLANVDTTGFKGTDTLFAQYIQKVDNNDRTFKDKVAFTHDFGLVRNLAQGGLNYTNNPFDLAIQGDGYFVTDGTDGGAERYTRSGSFTLDVDRQLVTQSGRTVQSVDGGSIAIPPEAENIVIQGDGSILNENNEEIGRIRVVSFDDERLLTQVDWASFLTVPGQAPIDMDRPQVAQGVLENSNVNGIVEMTRLIALNRAYADVTKLVQMEHQRKSKAAEVFTRQV